jgi:hypothetical protein
MEGIAWGMVMSGASLIGMLALWVMSATTSDGFEGTSQHHEIGHESASESAEVRRAA